MFGANFGIGAPIIIALHLDPGDFNTGIVWFATFLTMGLCALAINGASEVPAQAVRHPGARRRAGAAGDRHGLTERWPKPEKGRHPVG